MDLQFLLHLQRKKVLAENIKQQVVKDKKIIDDANKLEKKINSLELKLRLKLVKE